ncbi:MULTISPECIES: type II toxin-antitoxin system death-on-curing family toxin [Mycolicibacter]|uniref:Fido domain-containing protein n=1 Tax=Mycolicibacter longobardus TaxID=1108812 RepID=A0A1X1YBY1_9MYCO|nr:MULTISPECIES: Fic family protein [Mycolicibacter]ORW08541.1 hypothetical protein AWC16_19275 [Mycolicibacter longobardus]RAV04346.1 type II toxin-antitoxin system death-on-curing family toxin [Mycolicibacter senuensis]
MTELPIGIDDLVEINRGVTGGIAHVTDRGSLESALARPFHTFDGAPLHPTVAGQAGALLEGIVAAHGFSDGNKRTAWIATKTYLRLQGFRPLKVRDVVAADFVEGVAMHQYRGAEVAVWIAENLFP